MSRPSIQLRIAGVAFAAGAIILIAWLVRMPARPVVDPTPVPPTIGRATAQTLPTIGPAIEPQPSATAEATIDVLLLATVEIRAGVPPLNRDNCPDDYPIKGNDGDNGKIYHVRGRSSSYGGTDPEVCFATEADARAAGFRAPEN